MARGEEPGKVGTDVSKTALFQAVSAFLSDIRGEKKDAKRPPVGALEGYRATVIAAKAHEAVMTGNKIDPFFSF